VVNRFDDAVSIIDLATDTVVAHVTGADLGFPGQLRMETEIEFNRAGTRAYLSNQNLDVVQVLDIAGVHVDAPVLIGTVGVGVNPRGMATNATDTRLYVANVQTADISVVDIALAVPRKTRSLQRLQHGQLMTLLGVEPTAGKPSSSVGGRLGDSCTVTPSTCCSPAASAPRPARGQASSKSEELSSILR
jgi:DNA-binding beta-propeller fold protein YncE